MEVDSPTPSLLERMGDSRRGSGGRSGGARRTASAPYVGVYLFQFSTRFNAISPALLHSKRNESPLFLPMPTQTVYGSMIGMRKAAQAGAWPHDYMAKNPDLDPTFPSFKVCFVVLLQMEGVSQSRALPNPINQS